MTSPAASAIPAHERVEPVFFAGRVSRLYGCHHVPVAPSPPTGIVICPPIGHEYSRCHRALRQLAAQLAKAGHHAFRFDYSGTGDSAGEYGDASLRTWREDLSDAIEQTKRRTRTAAVGLIGLRLGAALALQVAEFRTDVRSLVLWNPVLDGPGLLREWRSAQRAFAAALGYPPDGLDEQVLGMPLSARLAGELGTLDVSGDGISVERVLVCHDRADQADVARLVARLSSRVRTMDVRLLEQPAIWRQEPLDAIVPFPALRTIVEWSGAPR